MRRGRRLLLESLEERRVLATLWVDSTPGMANTEFTATGGTQPASVPGLVLGTNLFTSINAAIVAANPTDTIYVSDGTYSELVDVNKQVFLHGNQFGVDGQTRAGLSETIVNGNAGTTAFMVSADDVELNGFTIRDQTNVNQFGAGVFLQPTSAGTEFRNNIVTFNVVGLFLANNDGANQTVIERNAFRQNNQPGAASGNGIYLDQFTAQGGVNNVLITNNTFEDNNSAGINFSSTNPAFPTNNITISQNTFNDNGNAISLFNTTNSSITKNLIEDSTGSQIAILGGVNNLSITENFIEDGDARGIRIADFLGSPNQNTAINNNSIENNAGPGLEVAVGSYTGTLNAEFNWWGSPTGPTSPVNPGGTGEEIVDPNLQVDFSPFLASGTDTQPGTPGFQGNLISPLGIALVGTPGNDTVIVNATSDNDGTYQFNADPPVPFTDITYFSFAALGGNDVLIINNPGGGLFAPLSGIFYDGGGQAADALSNRGGAANSGSYTPGPTNDAGIIVHVGAAATQTINFEGLAPADDTVAEANFTINGTAGANAINITNGPIVAAVQTVNVAIDAFEPLNFGNKTDVDINGQAAADTITLNVTTNAAGLATLDLFGHNATGVGDDGASDVFNLLSSPAAVSVLAAGQGGTDYFNNLATLLLDPLAGPLTINGGETAADADVARLQDSSDAGPDTVTFDRTSPTVGTIAGAAGGLVTYTNLEVLLFEGTAGGDTINVLATLAGTNYYVTGNGGGDAITLGNQTADFNGTFDGSLDNIQGDILLTGEFNPAGPGATDTLNIDDSGTVAPNNATISIDPAFNFALPAPAPGGTDSGAATVLTGFAPAVIRYRHGDSTFVPALFSNRIEFVNVLSGQGADNLVVNATTATNTTTIDARQGNDAVTIGGDGLSASNIFRGNAGNDQFTLNIAANLGATAFAPLTSLLIEGNDPGGDSENRDRLTINDNAAAARNLDYQYSAAFPGGVDIEPAVAGGGLAGAVNPGLVVNVRTMETVIASGAGNNDLVSVTGTANNDILTVGLLNNNTSALVFLGGTPYLDTPPVTVAGSLPGLAGGGPGPDLRINGLAPATGVLLNGGGIPAGGGDRAVVYAASEASLLTGGALDIFGFGPGVLIPGFGVGLAYDTINVSDSQVTTVTTGVGALATVRLATGSFVQGTPASPTQQAGLIVNGGDEAVAQASGISDNITALVSSNFNIQINGNLPGLVLGPDGLPIGDQLNLTGPGDINLFSDKSSPPNVTVTFSGNPSPFGVRHSSIERLLLDAGVLPGSGAVNLIGDNNDPAVDQNDNFVVLGRDIDGNHLDAGYQELTVSINGSAPILVNGVQRLNVFGDDAALTPSVGPNDIDTLEITPYSDNAGNPPNNAPRGWGVDVFFNEGNPAGADGDQADLIIYHTSQGMGGGGSVSEDIAILPSGPDSGEIRVTNATDGSIIVVLQYVANTDIVVLDDDGSLTDTDTLTLFGSNPNTPTTSGDETFDADFTAAGTPADPLVTVSDSATAAILYRLRDFTGISSIDFAGLGGDDIFRITGETGLDLQVDGGDGSDALVVLDAPAAVDEVIYELGTAPDRGRLTYEDAADATVMTIDFVGLEPVYDYVAADLSVFGNHADNSINYGTGPNSLTVNAVNPGGVETGLISIDNFESIEFGNKLDVTIDGRAGEDTISVSDGSNPGASGALNLVGNDPLVSDEVVLSGTTGADLVSIEITGPHSAIVTINGAVTNINTSAKLIYNGLGGDDDLTVLGIVAGDNRFVFTPSGQPDAGTITGVDTFFNLNFLPIEFVQLGVDGQLTIDGNSAFATELVVLGTIGHDTVSVESLTGSIALSTPQGGDHVTIATDEIESLRLEMLDGSDQIDLAFGLPYSALAINGGSPGAGSDVLRLVGELGVDEDIDVRPDAINPTHQIVTGLGPVAIVSGLELISFEGNLGDLDSLTVGPGNADDDIRVDDQDAFTVGRIRSTVLPEIHFQGLDELSIDGFGNSNVSATFATSFLPAATLYSFSGFAEDELIVEGYAGDNDWIVTNPLAFGGSVLIEDLNSGVAVRNTVVASSPGDVVIRGLGGDDEVTVDVDFAGSNSDLLTGINLLTFDGGTGSDLLTILGTPLTAVDELIYTPGPDITEGRLEYENADGIELMTIDFLNLEPVVDLVPAATLTVNGTDAANAINYTAGSVAANGLVSVDGFETIEFSNKSNLTINGLAGSDTINLNNPTTPAGLASITVNAGDPTDSDRLVVNGNAGFNNNILVSPTAAGNGTVADTAVGSPFVDVTFAGVEQLDVVGQSTDSDALRLNGTAGDDTYDITPGPSIDEGLAIGFSTGAGGFNFVPVRYSGFRNFLTFPEPPTAGSDTLRVNGTSGDDVFVYQDSPTFPTFPSISVNGSTEIFSGADTWVLRGLEGNDTFTIDLNPPTPSQPAFTPATIVIEGGDSDPAGDTVDYTAAPGIDVTVDFGSRTISQVGQPVVSYDGVELANVVVADANLTVEGSRTDDVFDVSPYLDDSVTVQLTESQGALPNQPIVNAIGMTAFTVNGGTGDDTLKVRYSSNPETIDVNGVLGLVNVTIGGPFEPVSFLGIDALEVYGNEGNDDFIVTPSATMPIFIDGDDPIGTIPGDSITVLGAVGFFPGPENDEGGFLTLGETVSFDHIESLIVAPNGLCPFLILGTNGDDDITVIARDASTHIGADGIQDFTVSVNAGPDILFLDEPDLFIDALSGDDDIVIRAPAPNDSDWDVNVRVAGGPPSIGEPNEGDRLVLETPGEDSIVFNPTGADTGNIVVDEDGNLAYDAVGTDSIITFGPFVFICDDPVGDPIEFTYISSPGGVELVEYDGETTAAGATLDDITINGTAVDDLTTANLAGGPGGVNSGSFVSGASPLFHFRSFVDLTANAGTGGFDRTVINATEAADTVTSDNDTVILTGMTVTLSAAIDRLDLHTFGGNDNINLDLVEANPLFVREKVIDAGNGNDIVDLSGLEDALVFGGLGDDLIIGTPLADEIYGGAGNDTLIGGGGIDTIYGEAGNDRFGDAATGNAVADDPGNDRFFGGEGSDTFVWDPGDGSDTIEGGADESDVLIFNGSAAAEIFTLNAVGTRLELLRNLGAIDMDVAGVEEVRLNMLDGDDAATVNDLFQTDVRFVQFDVGLTGNDAVTVNGREVSDQVNISNVAGIAAITGLRYDVRVAGAAPLAGVGGDVLTFNGNGGNDNVVANDNLNTLFAPEDVITNGGDGDDFLSGYGNLNGDAGNDTLLGGAFFNLITGGEGDDLIHGGGGADTLLGDAGEDTFVPGFDLAIDSIDGGAGFDTILVQATSANDRIDARQDAIGQVSYEISGVNGGNGVLGGAGTETDVIVPGTVEELEIIAGSGDDIIRVAHADGLIAGGQQIFSLRFTVDGGAPGASDRLTVTDEGLGDTTIHRIGGTAGDGSFAMGALAPVVYTGIEFASLNPVNPVTGGYGGDGLGRLFVFKHDPYEQNSDRLNATFLGSNSATNVDPTIDPGADALFGLPGDEDWYRIVPQNSGDLDIRIFFRQQGVLANGRAGLPGDGNLDIALYDADGLPVEIAGTGLFGTNDATDDERIRIPAVAGQTYYLRVKGAALADLASPAINVYNVSVINTPAAVPIDLELDDVIGVATIDAVPAPTATTFDATGTAPFVLSTVNDFYNGKDIVFTSGNLNGIRGRVLDYIGATQTFVFAAGTFFAPPTAGSSFQIESPDTGRSQFDNITRDTTPTIFLRVPNVVNVGGVATLDDVPFNGTAPGAPPDEFIGIPFVTSLLLDATAPGFRVPIFITEHGTSDQGPPNNVLAGYAQPVDPVNRPGLFSFTFGSPGSFITELPVFPGTSETTSFFLSARVEVIDPAQPQQAQGYGDFAESLEIVVDTQPPPVFFGLPNDPDDGLLPDSDTGLNTNPETLNDLVTSDTTPGLFGQAEADAVIRLFIDAPEPGFPTGDGTFDPAIDFQIGFDVAEPFDGTNQYPNGYWQVDAINVNLNAAPFSPTDGLRRIFVTAEDVAGNINPEVGQVVQELEIFIDTQGPQITDVEINNQGNPYDLFDPKPSTDGPTPLVNSIVISIQDLPPRVLPLFDQPAFKPDIAENPGHYLLTGDYNGIIPILDVIVTLDPVVNGQPATGTVELVFREAGADGIFNTADDIGDALPDDRFTLFVNDEGLIDFAGNIGDLESNADEPHESSGPTPILGVDGVPTGDGLPGGDFFARFTVDTRPEVGVWAAGSAWVDTNGNTSFDPTNEDFTNRDISYSLGLASDNLFAGKFVDTGAPNDGNAQFDKLAAYGRNNGNFRWLVDTDNDGVPDVEQIDPAAINGLPVAGNFGPNAGDEVGLHTGTRWHFDSDHNFQVDFTIPWPAAGHPVVGDFDGDGFDDLASWTNDIFSVDLSSVGAAGPVAALNNAGLGTGVNGTIDRTFKFGFIGVGERPVAADMNMDGIEDLGLWVPARDGITPREGSEWYFLISGVVENDTPSGGANPHGPSITGGQYAAGDGPGDHLGFATYGLVAGAYTNGRIVDDPMLAGPGNIVRFNPTPFGEDQFIQFGDEFAMPLLGNFDPPVSQGSGGSTRDPLDVNDDGHISPLDALLVINELNRAGGGPSQGASAFNSGPYLDVSGDSFVSPIDALLVINHLNAQSGLAAQAEGEPADEFFSELGSSPEGEGSDEELMAILATDTAIQPKKKK